MVQRSLYVIYSEYWGELRYYTDVTCTKVFSPLKIDSFVFTDIKVADRVRESLEKDEWTDLGIRVLVSKKEIDEFGGDIEIARTDSIN